MQSSHPLSRTDVERLAAKHSVSPAAIEALAAAIAHAGGRAAQFSHPDLGGMGQWMAGGMLMIGDMFNHELKARVDRICHDVADAIAKAPPPFTSAADALSSAYADWWPAAFGRPSAVGAQNDMRYAFFPAARRLVIEQGGVTAIYDTGDYYISGVSQQQSSSQTLSFSGPAGPVPIDKLRRLDK